MTTASALTKPVQIRMTRRSPAYWRVTIDNPPLNVMSPEMVKQFQQVMNALEADEQVTLACDMSFASREKTIISQWEVGVGMVAGGGPMARLPRLIGRNRALEVLLSSEDIRAEQAEAYGYISRPGGRRARCVRRGARDADRQVRQMGDRQHQAARQHQLAAGRRTRRRVGCVHQSLGRSAAQEGIKALTARGFQKPGDVENRLGYYLGQI